MKLFNKCLIFVFCLFFVASCATAEKKGEKPAENAAENGAMTREEINYLFDLESRHLFVNESETDNELLRRTSAPALMEGEGYNLLERYMMDVLLDEQGVGIAAPQVGINRRLIIVQRMDKENNPFEYYYNIVIKEKRGGKAVGWEGCLSVPAGFGKVERWQDIDIEYDALEDGKLVRKSENIKGFTAVIFQHETDHLDGILFVDKKVDEPLVPKDEYREMRLKEKAAKEAKEQNNQ